MSGDYQLVQLASGAKTLFSASYGEKMHPGLGPAAEAELLYVRQLKLCDRLESGTGEFVIWDIGLGGAANAIAALKATQHISGQLRLVSFDNTAEPLAFALNNADALGYPAGYEIQMAELLKVGTAPRAVPTPPRGIPTTAQCVKFQNGSCAVEWEFHLGDFPAWLQTVGQASPRPASDISLSARGDARPTDNIPAPHAVFYDAFSPAKNPAMWTLPVFAGLFRALDPQRPCALTTYSRSTLLRTTLLIAGFYVGVGHATGLKEETTIAANTLDLLAEPLGARWLERAMRSDSAEPLHEPRYSRAQLSPATAEQLRSHPQFSY